MGACYPPFLLLYFVMMSCLEDGCANLVALILYEKSYRATNENVVRTISCLSHHECSAHNLLSLASRVRAVWEKRPVKRCGAAVGWREKFVQFFRCQAARSALPDALEPPSLAAAASRKVAT